MSSFQLQADMYNSITPNEIEVRNLEERVKKLENEIRPHGKWIMNKTSARGRNYTCTNCNKVSRNKFDFCPNCGADMREDNNESIQM